MAEEGRYPLDWSDSEGVKWKTPLPGAGSSSPVVVGQRIFLTAYTGYGIDSADPGDKSELRLHVLAFELGSGKLLWDREIVPEPDEPDATPRIVDHGYASPTPTADERMVFAAFGPSGLVALNHDGEIQWRVSIGSGTAGFGAAASPILFENLVIINASIESGQLYAFDKQSGKQVWARPQVQRAWTTPTFVPLQNGAVELVLNHKDQIVGIDPRTGRDLWWCDGIEDYIVPCPVAHAGVVYCSGGRQNRTLAVRAGGRGDVTETHRLWEANHGANVTSPLYHDGYLYWSHDRGLALCVRAEDGEIVYQQRLDGRERVYASIVAADGKFYLTKRDGSVLVLNAEPDFTELATNRLTSPTDSFNATPALVDGQLLMRSNEFLYCIQPH